MPRALTSKLFKSVGVGFLVGSAHGIAHYLAGNPAVFAEAGVNTAGVAAALTATLLTYYIN